MARKKFETQDVFEKFFTPETQETQITSETQETQITQITEEKPAAATQVTADSAPVIAPAEVKKPTVGRPKKRGDTYRFSLYLDSDLEKYVKFAVWRDRKESATQYFNDLVRKEMAQYLENGGQSKDWE